MKKEKRFLNLKHGITIEQWLRYASPESLSLYMYQNPKRAKKLYSDVVPKAVDDYLDNIEKYESQTTKNKLLNTVWHIHKGKPPKEKIIMPFSMLLNIVGSSNAKTKRFYGNLLKNFIKRLNQKIIKFLMN